MKYNFVYINPVFHVQCQNEMKNQGWGKVHHTKDRIDSTPKINFNDKSDDGVLQFPCVLNFLGHA